MKRKKTIVVLGILMLLSMVLVSACDSSPKPSPTKSITLTSTQILPALQVFTPAIEKQTSPTSTLTPSRTITPSRTPALPNPTDTFQTEIASTIKYNCLEILNELPVDPNISGKLMFRHFPGDQESSSVTFKVDSKDWFIFPVAEGEKVVALKISPDHKKLAYERWNEKSRYENLFIEAADGTILKEVPLEYNKYGLQGWLDNDRLWFTYGPDPIQNVMILNPFTGERVKLLSQYEGLKRIDYNGYPFLYTYVVYSPSMLYVIYPQQENGSYIVLFDRENNKIVSQIKDLTHFGHMPIWSQDESMFFIPVDPYLIEASSNSDNYHQEWFMVEIDGKAHQLTHFADLINSNVIGQASLSPDGNIIAFWMGRDYQNLPKLRVLDLQTLQVTNYCIPGSRNGSWAPIWSPDSNYLAVMSDVTLAEGYAVIVSVEGEWAAKVGEGYLPEGWMASP